MGMIGIPPESEALSGLGRAGLETLTSTSILPNPAAWGALLHVEGPVLTRWVEAGESAKVPTEANFRIIWLSFVMSRLLEMYSSESVRVWLHGKNAFLRDQEPWALLEAGKYQDVLAAINQERADSYA